MMDLQDVRKVSWLVQDLEEVSHNEASKVISFRKLSSGCRINVYYTTGTVGTCLNHPHSGKSQLFRRKVTYTVLEGIFRNPRIHTGDGYYRNNHRIKAAGSKRSISSADLYDSDSEIECEEVELDKQLCILQSQMDVIVAQLKCIEETKALEKERLLRAKKEQERERRQEEEEERRLEEERERREAFRAEKRRRSQLINARGNTCYWSLDDSDDFPDGMADVACVAIADGGYIAVFDDGTCRYDGIPDDVIEILRKQHFSNIAYIALGPEGQYYILKKNGRRFMNVPGAFEDDLNAARSHAKYVSFGTWGTYYIAFKNGAKNWSDDLPLGLENILQNSDDVISVWLGESSYGDIPYLVAYGRGVYACDSLPYEVEEWFEDNWTNTKNLRQLLASDDCFFVRYS